MNNEDIWRIAAQQSAYDCHCSPEDFFKSTNKVVLSRKHPKARKYLPLPFQCDFVSYGSNIVAQVDESLVDIVTEYIGKYSVEHCFETPNINALNDMLEPHNLKVCFMAEYFLPDITRLEPLACDYELRLLEKKDFENLYLPQWSNALCSERKELDVLGAGAYENGKLIGLAGCSADCENMYQIGIDVLPQYRRQGVAASLTSHLALEIIARDKVPFYCAAWSNIKSVRNAIKCGFRPAWVELTARDCDFVNRMNQPVSR